MDTSKVYTLYRYDYSAVSCVFIYSDNKWINTFGGGYHDPFIREQTKTSIKFCLADGEYYIGYHDPLIEDCAVLEGDIEATAADFAAGATRTNTLVYYYCFKQGTLITLADRTTKKVEDITYDDNLLVWNFYEGKFDSAKPMWIKKPEIASEYNLCKFSNGVEVGFVGQGGSQGYHRIYNDEAKCFTHTGVKDTPIGTTTFAEDSTMPKLVSQEVVKEKVTFYNIITDKHYNLFANGILTSCRLSNKYEIKNMKYVGDLLISEQEEREYFDRREKIRSDKQ